MNIIKPLKILLFSFVITVTLTACGGGNSSSEDSSADVTVTTESGVTALFDTNEATVDEIFEFFYDLGGDEFTGTIRWGDNTETRVRGSGSARHFYRGEGEVTISIQVDGREPERVGGVVVVLAMMPTLDSSDNDDEDSSSSSASSQPSPVSHLFEGGQTSVTFVCVDGNNFSQAIVDSNLNELGSVGVTTTGTAVVVSLKEFGPGSPSQSAIATDCAGLVDMVTTFTDGDLSVGLTVSGNNLTFEVQ